MDFWQIYRIVLRKKWIIVAITLLATAATAIGFNMTAKFYRAVAVLMPSDAALLHRSSLGGDPGTADPGVRSMRFASLMALAKSQNVAERASKELGSRTSPENLMQNITVGPVMAAEGRQQTEMIQIEGFARDPKLAVESANAVAHAYEQYYQDITHQEATQNRKYLEMQYNITKQKLLDSEKALADFKTTRQLVSLPDELGAALSGLGPLRGTRDDTQAQLSEVDARLEAYRSQLHKISPVRTIHDDSFENPIIRELETKQAQLESQYVMELAVHTPKYSRVRLLEMQIASVKSRLNDELKKNKPRSRVVSNPVYETARDGIINLETERRGLAARLSQIEGILAQRQASLTRYTGLDDRLEALNREYHLAETNYTTIAGELSQARLNEKISNNSGGIAIVDLATTADGPVRKGLSGGQLIFAAFILSLLAGIGLVIAIEALDNTIRTGKDAEEVVGLPVTGLIPRITSGEGIRALPKITHIEPASAHAEAYRFLGTDFLFTAADEPMQTVMVATAQPGQGGTTTITNLAITIAQAGRRVVLVDADMRRPEIHTIFGVDNEVGLSSVLQDKAALAEALKPTGVDNLLLLSAGPVPSNAWKLLRSRRMREIIETLKEQSDFIFFDSPSAIVFADAAVLASMVDGVILVVRAQQSPRGSELQVRNLLNKAKANIISVVLNDASPETVDSYRYHSNYYNLNEISSIGNGKEPKSLIESSSD